MDPAPIEPPKPHLKALTGLRFLAASMIVAFHSLPLFHLDNKHIFSQMSLPQGVTLFFVLSGFILTYTHSNLSGWRDARKFISMRLARIWPTHLVCLLFAVVLVSWRWGQPIRWIDASLNLFLLHSLSVKSSCFFYLNNVSWSISTEFFFYLLFPFLILTSRKNIWFPFLGSAILTTISLTVACWQSDLATPDGRWFALAYINPLTRIAEFGLGMSTACLYLSLQKKLHTMSRTWVTVAEILAVAACCLTIANTPDFAMKAFLSTLPAPLNFYWHESGGAIFYALLILVLAVGRGVCSNLLSSASLVWLGEISFAIYMIHHLVINLFSELGLLRSSYPRLGLFACYLIVTMIVAAVLHYSVEQPCRKKWNNFLRERTLPECNLALLP